MYQDQIKQIFTKNLRSIMNEKNINFKNIAEGIHDKMQVKDKSDKQYYPFNELDKKTQKNKQSTCERWGNNNNDNLPKARELYYLCKEILDCDIDYLFSNEKRCLNDDNQIISDYLDWEEEAISKIKTMSIPYKLFLSRMLQDGSLEEIINIIDRYLKMVKLQNITISEEGVSSETYDKEKLIAVATHQATNAFSIILSQISSDTWLDDYVNAGHSIAVFSNEIQSNEFKKKIESIENSIISGEKTFNGLCDEEEKKCKNKKIFSIYRNKRRNNT